MENRKRKADDDGLNPSTADTVPEADPTTADSVPKVDPAMAAYIEKKRKEHDDALVRQGQALWAAYWAKRSRSLSMPFGRLPNYPEVIEMNMSRSETVQQAAAPSEFPQHGITDKNPPLSYDVIASILWKTKGDCPKAQAWLKNHELDRMLRGGAIIRHYGRENLRKRALHNMQQMSLATRQVSTQDSARETLATSKPTQKEDDVEENQENDATTPFNRILEAHDRLRKAMGEPEVFAHEILLW
ncbi:hypothetical protein ASPBRDRAFT_32702 [Aspergillus brasiliensis CBS 101740]|uniref:Uncharacterized protein n=1 Tax=Aspergillus brasiliensis (strain CBS 101740 / IMI 381727 / IBT 21946) TaxID=767769 RepID=A0A1L9UB95_ASPBC|nr:hypothetical protein ASPBRDRAFT_32702 [Aspergillus brasiliensis CBS 101740]